MLVNPISFRLSISIFWKSTWSLYNYTNYKYLFYSDIVFFEYFCFFFKKMLKSGNFDYSISHIRFSRWNDNLIINIYYYNSAEDLKFHDEKKKQKYLKLTQSQKEFNMIKTLLRLTKKIFLAKKYKVIKENLVKDLKFLIFKHSKKYIVYKLIKPLWFKKNKNYIINKIIYLIFKQKTWKEDLLKKINNILSRKFKKYSFLKKQLLLKKSKKIVYNNIKKYILKELFYYINDFFIVYYAKYRNFIVKKLYNSLSFSLYKKKIYIKNKKKIKYNLIKAKFYLKVKKIYKKYNKIRIFIFKNRYFKKIKKILYNVIIKKSKKKLKYKKKKNLNLFFLSKLYKKKIKYNYKYFFYNIYLYLLSKFLKNEIKFRFLNFIFKFKINLLKITFNAINAKLIGLYIKTSFRKRYSLWDTLKPILADLNKRLLYKQIGGFKLSIIGRFKRVSRAVFWWQKNGGMLAATTTTGVDFERIFYRTKYGISTINVWITPGKYMFKSYLKMFPKINPLFFNLKNDLSKKINYFFLKKNNLFFQYFFKRLSLYYSSFDVSFLKNFLLYILYKFFYINMFLKNLYNTFKLKKNDVKNFLKKIFLPQYCVYKINIEDFLKRDIIKITPFITLNVLKRLNIRSSYKIYFIRNNDADIKLYKYKILI